jgi:dTDP-4-dehydrorhamnose reductase
MQIIITGGNGQLGRALQRVLTEHELTIIDLPGVDITERGAVEREFTRVRPDLVIHCAAYTDVEGCARQPDLAYRINGLGTQNVAIACRLNDADLIHLSTNEVFPGENPDGYEEWMQPRPINPYGRSKTYAEMHVRSILNHYYIIRTSWLYAPGGGNFIHAILNRARSKGQIQVVTDEIANPTSVFDLAHAISKLILTRQYGIYHFVNEGACSRWEFANEILRLAGLETVDNSPILSRQYQRLSTPPLYGALVNQVGAAIGINLRPWPEALADYMAEFA